MLALDKDDPAKEDSVKAVRHTTDRHVGRQMGLAGGHSYFVVISTPLAPAYVGPAKLRHNCHACVCVCALLSVC